MNENPPTGIPSSGPRASWRFRLAYRLIGHASFVANVTLVLPPGAAVEKNSLGPSYMRSCQLSAPAGHQRIPGTEVIDVALDGTFILHR